MLDGEVYKFCVAGLSNGLAVMVDDKTRSLWDHILGEAFDGPLKGRKLDVWPIYLTTVEAALHEYPDITISLSSFRSLGSRFMQMTKRRAIDGGSFLPPPFRHTMGSEIDPRLDKLAQGLGVVDGHAAKFYPMDLIARGDTIVDTWQGRELAVERRSLDGVLHAVWQESGEEPMQLLSRWYGFSFTYPDCELYVS